MTFIKYFPTWKEKPNSILRAGHDGKHTRLTGSFHVIKIFWECVGFVPVAVCDKHSGGKGLLHHILPGHSPAWGKSGQEPEGSSTADYSTHFQPGNLQLRTHSRNHGGTLIGDSSRESGKWFFKKKIVESGGIPTTLASTHSTSWGKVTLSSVPAKVTRWVPGQSETGTNRSTERK